MPVIINIKEFSKSPEALTKPVGKYHINKMYVCVDYVDLKRRARKNTIFRNQVPFLRSYCIYGAPYFQGSVKAAYVTSWHRKRFLVLRRKVVQNFAEAFRLGQNYIYSPIQARAEAEGMSDISRPTLSALHQAFRNSFAALESNQRLWGSELAECSPLLGSLGNLAEQMRALSNVRVSSTPLGTFPKLEERLRFKLQEAADTVLEKLNEKMWDTRQLHTHAPLGWRHHRDSCDVEKSISSVFCDSIKKVCFKIRAPVVQILAPNHILQFPFKENIKDKTPNQNKPHKTFTRN